MSKPRLWSIMGVLMLVEVLGSLENAMIFTALPKISADFKDIAGVGWLITAFVLAQAGTAAVGGRLGDLFGRKKLLLAFVAISTVGSIVSAVGTDLNIIILGRVLQGVSGAILPLCYGMAREIAPRKEAQFWVGCLTGAFAIAHAVGFVLGGVLADLGGWHTIFICTSVYGTLLLIPMVLFLPRTNAPGLVGKLDLGGLLFVPAVVGVMFGVAKAPQWGWDNGLTWGFILGGLALLAFWAWHESRQANPLLDVKLLARREVWLANLCFAVMAVGTVQAPLLMMMLLQQPVWTGVGLGVSATFAGISKLPSSVFGAISSPISGWVCGRWGGRVALLQGAGLCILAWVWLFFFHSEVWQVIAGTALVGFSTTILLVAVPNLVMEGAPMERSSEASGLSMVVKYVSVAIGVQAVTALLATSRMTDPATGANFPSPAAYELTIGAITVTVVILFIVGLFIPSRARIEATAASASAPTG